MRNLGTTVTGVNPKLAFVDELNVKLANTNDIYRYSQVEDQDNTINPTIPTNNSLNTVKTNPVDTRHSNLQNEISTLMLKLSTIEKNPVLDMAPSTSNPVPMDLMALPEAQISKYVKEGLAQINVVKDTIQKLENNKVNSPSNNEFLGGGNLSQWNSKVMLLEAKFKAVGIAYPIAIRLFMNEKQLEKAIKQSTSELGFKNTSINLPSINNEEIITLYMNKNRLYNMAAKGFSIESAGVAGALMKGLAEAASVEAQNALSEAYNYNSQYNMGGMSAGASSLDNLVRLAESKSVETLEESLEEERKGLDDIISETLGLEKTKDELYTYFDELLPGYGTTYKDIDNQKHDV